MKVSVCFITYNHEAYVAQALDSVLTQTIDFDMEVIIGEDWSRDNTRNICVEYTNNHPGLVRLVSADRNVGMMRNFHRTLQQCTGDYIAFMEGDDFWTDPAKLQKQVKFLEAHPGHSACFHNVVVKTERGGENHEWVLHEELAKSSFNTEDVLGPWFIPSISFVFRNYRDLNLPDWFFNCRYGDLPMMLLLSLRGEIGYLNEVMGVYRLHDNGLTTKNLGYDKIILMVYIYESFNIHTHYRFAAKAREAMVYEISRHVPLPEPLPPPPPPPQLTLLERGYRKIKRTLRPRLPNAQQ